MNPTVEAYYRPEHGSAPVAVRTDNDVDALIDQLLTEPLSNSIAALYHRDRPLNPAGVPDHELYLAVYPPAAVGGLCYRSDGTWYTKGQASERDEVFYYYMGADTDFPIDSEVPVSLLRQAVKEFLHHSGARPTCVSWQAESAG